LVAIAGRTVVTGAVEVLAEAKCVFGWAVGWAAGVGV